MAIPSDLVIDDAKFDPANISPAAARQNEDLMERLQGVPRWYEVGAEKFRQMRWNGETSAPRPLVIESGVDFSIPSREPGRSIACRVFKPANGAVRGVFMHVHGGGWCFQSEKYQDAYLKLLADSLGLAAVSVGYRLAPEHPFPAGPEDCFDAAEWLMRKSRGNYGADLMFMGGESAGAHLAVLTVLHLLKTQPGFALRGVLLNFGCYDLSYLPQARHFTKPLVLDQSIMEHFIGAFVPNTSIEQRRDPAISPFYANFNEFGRAKMPPALFTCGSEDPLLDDTLMLAVKWRCHGSEAITKIFTGAPHGFILFPPSVCEAAQPGLDVTQLFIREKLA